MALSVTSAVFTHPIRARDATTNGTNSAEFMKNWLYPPLFTSRSSASTARTVHSSTLKLFHHRMMLSVRGLVQTPTQWNQSGTHSQALATRRQTVPSIEPAIWRQPWVPLGDDSEWGFTWKLIFFTTEPNKPS